MTVTNQEGIRRRPFLRGTLTLTLPTLVLLAVLVVRNLYRHP